MMVACCPGFHGCLVPNNAEIGPKAVEAVIFLISSLR
jgi:hypothetical protein